MGFGAVLDLDVGQRVTPCRAQRMTQRHDVVRVEDGQPGDPRVPHPRLQQVLLDCVEVNMLAGTRNVSGEVMDVELLRDAQPYG